MSGIRNIRRVKTYDASIPYTNNVQVNGADVIQVNGADPVYPVNVNGIPFTFTGDTVSAPFTCITSAPFTCTLLV